MHIYAAYYADFVLLECQKEEENTIYSTLTAPFSLLFYVHFGGNKE